MSSRNAAHAIETEEVRPMPEDNPRECGCGILPQGELTRQRCHRLYQIHGGHSVGCIPLTLVRARLEELGDLLPAPLHLTGMSPW
jgi:hypothetical protein